MEVVETCRQLVLAHHVARPEAAADVLDALQRYVNWMDVGLLVNDTWLPLLFDCVQAAAADAALRGAAADVLGEVLSKRMEAVQKLQLVQQLPVVGVMGTHPYRSTWHPQYPGPALCGVVCSTPRRRRAVQPHRPHAGLRVQRDA